MATAPVPTFLLHLILFLLSLAALGTASVINTSPEPPSPAPPQIGQPCFIHLNCTTPKTVCLGFACVCEPGLEYDKVLGQCVQSAGGKCGQASETRQCASNAHCNPVTNTCACNEPEYSLHQDLRGYGKCFLNYGQNCDVSTSSSSGAVHGICNPFKYLKCRPKDMKCGCVEFGQVYDENLGTCVAKPGEVCDLVQYDGLNFEKLACIRNAYCAKTVNYDNDQIEDEDRLIDNEDYQIARCKCKPGFVNVAGENCMPGYDKKCDLDTVNSEPEVTCAPNMNLECHPDSNLSLNTIGRCACAPGSVLTGNGGPQLQLGTTATLTGYEVDYVGDEGDDRDNSGYDYEYDTATGIHQTGSACVRVLLHAEFCSPSRDICTSNSACVENEIYSFYSGNTFATSKCQCLSGFAPTPDGVCKLGHGSPCDREHDAGRGKGDGCNEYLGLECASGSGSGTCQCPTRMLNEFNGTHCVVLEGGVCLVSSSSSYCTNNAFCSPETETCQCLEAYSTDEALSDHKCYPATLNAPCDSDKPTRVSESESSSLSPGASAPCLPSTGLTCVGGRCICENGDADSEDDDYVRELMPVIKEYNVDFDFDPMLRKCVLVPVPKFVDRFSSEISTNGQERVGGIRDGALVVVSVLVGVLITIKNAFVP